MKKNSLSIHKSFLNKQTSLSLKTKKTIKIVKPGSLYNTVTKPSVKQKTDRGNQLLTLSYYKKCLKNTRIENNRLDLIIFYLKFSKSLSESKHLISQRFIKVNNQVITNQNTLLEDFSVIECLNKNSFINSITHDISNTLIVPTNIYKLNDNTGIYYHDSESKSILLPKNINIGLMRRMK